MPDEIEALWTRGREMLADAGRRDPRHQPAAHQITRLPHLLRHRTRRGLVEPRRYDGGSATATARSFRRATASPRCTRRPAAEGFRPRGAPPRHGSAHTSCPAGYYDAYYNRARKVRTLYQAGFRERPSPGGRGMFAILIAPANALGRFRTGARPSTISSRCISNDVYHGDGDNPPPAARLSAVPAGLVCAAQPAPPCRLGLQLIGKPWQREANC